MNAQNLIPNSQRTHEQLSAMGHKGGIKSGEVRRKHRDLQKKYARIFAAMEYYEQRTGKPLFDEVAAENLYFIATGKHSRAGRPRKH